MTDETSLAILTRASEMLAKANTIQQAKELKDLALTAADWARRKGMGKEAEQHCRSYAVRAEIKMGEMLQATEEERAKGAADGKPGPGRGKKNAVPERNRVSDTPTLADLGITKKESSQAQMLASLPESMKAEVIIGKMTMTDTKRAVRKQKSTEERAAILITAPKAEVFIGTWEQDHIYHADISTVKLPCGVIDLVVTDPPWTDDSLSVYSEVFRLSREALKPGAFCAVYAGKMFLPQIVDAALKYLEYVWTFAAVQFDNNSKIAKWHLFEAWRPILVFRKPGQSLNLPWIPDAFRCQREKTHHEWQQGSEPIHQLVEAYCPVSGIVLDPCVGGGTVPTVAVSLGRHFLGFDINPESVQLSTARIEQVPHARV